MSDEEVSLEVESTEVVHVVEEAIETAVEEAPVEEVSVEEVSVEEAIETAVEEAPVVEEVPVEEVPVEEVPVEEVPVEEVPVEEVPVEEVPAVEEAIETAVVEAPVVEEVPVEEAPAVEEVPVVEEAIETAIVEPVEEVVEAVPVVEEMKPEEPITMIIGEIINVVPKIVFIVPYRDREEQRRFFEFQMKTVLEDYASGETVILYSHQADQRSFNRGAMKNIGFLYVKQKYPNDYQNITIVFNDVDTMPYTKGFIHYETTLGNVKHFYGYTFTLGGIVSIKGADLEKTNGFPNYWAWGYEDNAFQRRVQQAGLHIDRSQFYPILDKNILQLKDGITRVVNRGEFDRYVDEVKYQNNQDGIQSLSYVLYDFDENSRFINIRSFQTPVQEQPELTKLHDMRDGPAPFLRPPQQRRGRPRMGMMF